MKKKHQTVHITKSIVASVSIIWWTSVVATVFRFLLNGTMLCRYYTIRILSNSVCFDRLLFSLILLQDLVSLNFFGSLIEFFWKSSLWFFIDYFTVMIFFIQTNSSVRQKTSFYAFNHLNLIIRTHFFYALDQYEIYGNALRNVRFDFVFWSHLV